MEVKEREEFVFLAKTKEEEEKKTAAGEEECLRSSRDVVISSTIMCK